MVPAFHPRLRRALAKATAKMGVITMQKYRTDKAKPQADGSVNWYTDWIGGPTLAKIANCRLAIAGDMRRTVYITGEPDTWFSIPAVCKIAGCRVRGYITGDSESLIFQPCCPN